VFIYDRIVYCSDYSIIIYYNIILNFKKRKGGREMFEKFLTFTSGFIALNSFLLGVFSTISHIHQQGARVPDGHPVESLWTIVLIFVVTVVFSFLCWTIRDISKEDISKE